MKRFRPGVSFSDFVVSDFSGTKSRLKEQDTRDYRRGWLIWLVMLLGFGLLFVRLAVLQVFKGDMYTVLADENRIKTLKVPAQRGIIYDRNDKELARGEKYTYTDEMGREREAWKRIYPYGEATSHVLGYLSEVMEDEVGLLKNAGKKYEAKDMIGRMGLEQAFESSLRGVDGGKLIEVDNAGSVVRSLGLRQPTAGHGLYTTLDAELSRVAYEGLMKSRVRKGAAIVSNPQTGEVLALVSAPGFDPKNIAAALTDGNLPMFNRAIGGIYPPGSTFKMNTTIAAIDSGKVKSDFVYTDTGVVTVGTFRYTNWLFTKHGGTEGVVNFSRSLTRSTDTFFYKVGEMTGSQEIASWAKRLGMGEKTGVEIGGEVEGIVGTPETRKRLSGSGWFLGDTYHMAIGQADTLLTPIQVNRMTNVLAADGRKCPLHMVIQANSGECETVQISASALKIVHEGMLGACSPGGTAFPLFDWNEAARAGKSTALYTSSSDILPVLACKTGTAEYVGESGKMRTHAWLTIYAPADAPRISVTVLVEGGGEGSNAAAPIARQILAKFFDVSDTYPYANIPQETGE